MITKVAFVGFPTTDLEAARRFWNVLGLEHRFDMDDKWTEFDAPDGKTVALDTFSSEAGGKGTYLALESDDIEGELSRLEEAGVKILKGVWDNQVCKMALIEDPEGRVVMIHQMSPERAKQG